MRTKKEVTLLICLTLLTLIKYTTAGPGLTESTQWGWNLTAVVDGSVVFGDVDNDGDLDLALVGDNGTYVAKLYINNGTSLEESEQWQWNLTGVTRSSIAFGDLDNDGYLDLIITGSNDGSNGFQSKIYINNGSSLQENESWQANLTDAKIWSGSVAVGDVDNDGLLDLVASGADTNGGEGVYINNGTSLVKSNTWTPSSFPNGGRSLGDMAIALGDFDNDADLDMLVMGSYSTTFYGYVYINNGTSFVEDSVWEENLPAPFGWPSVSVSDEDNDGDLDFAYIGTRAGDRFRIFTNNLTTFIQDQAESGQGSYDQLSGIFRGSIMWGDMDNDGDLDIAALGQEGYEHIYNSNGTVLWKDTTVDAGLIGDLERGSLAWGDVDGDGDLDLVSTGRKHSDNSRQTVIYISNQSDTYANTMPSHPTSFENYSTANGIFFGWGEGNDTETNVTGLYYNLRIGNCSGCHDIVSGVYGGGEDNGYFGNMMQRRNITLKTDRFSADATYYWSVQTIDTTLNASNWSAEQEYKTTTDITYPEITLDSPANLLTQASASTVFNYTVVEANIDTCELWGNWTDGWHLNESIVSPPASETNGSSNITLEEGQYVWNVWCNDSVGNADFASSNRTFTIDNTRPSVSQKNPVTGETWRTGTVTFTYQVSDFSSISSCQLYINGSQNSTSSSITKDTNQTFSSITLFDDEYEWYVKCTDGVGNSQDSTTWYLTQGCTVAWTCGSWSTCSSGNQSRTCTNVNSCPAQATETTESQSCGGNGGGPGGGGGGGGGGRGVVSAFDIDFSLQRTRSLRTAEGAVSSLSFDGVTKHTIKTDKVTSDSATITIASEPVTVTMKVGEKVTVDYNKDGVMDMEITLKSVMGTSADIVISKLAGADIVAKEDEEAAKQKYSFSKKELRVEVTQGETIQETFRVRNDGIETLALNLEVSPELKSYVVLSKDSIVLNKGQDQNIEVNFLAPATLEPGIYSGKIIVKTNLKEQSIPIQMIVKKREALFDVIVEIPEEFKEIFAGDKILAKIDLFNIGKIGKVDTILNYFIKDPSGNVVVTEQETIGIETKTGFTKSFLIPKTVTPGNYTYLVELAYKDTTTTGQTNFMVKSKISYIPTIIQKRLVEILVWVFGTALLFTIYFLIRSKFKEKYLEKREEKLEEEFKKFKKKKK